MTVGPGGIGPGPFGRGELRAGLTVPVRQRGGVHETLPGQAGDLEHLPGVPLLGPALALGGPAPGLLRRVVDAKQLRGLVKQRNVRHGPRVRGIRAEQQGPFGRGKTGSGPAQGTFRAEQPGHQPLRGQERPQRVQRGPDRQLVPEPGAGVRDVLGIELAVERLGFGRGQRAEQLGREKLAGHIVRFAQAAGPVAGAHDRLPRQRHRQAVHGDLHVTRRYLLEVAQRAAEHGHHLRVALDHGGIRIVVEPGLDPREELRHRAEHHVGLPEGGQHLADVAEEGGVRADDQDAASLQRLAVRVQQVGGPVQRRDRLAGARAALHHHHAGDGGANHPVLFGLNGGDHIAHPAGAAGGNAGDQHRLARQAFPVRFRQPLKVEDLVVDAGDRAIPGVNVAAPDKAIRVFRGGRVKGLCGGRAPVDKPRLEVGVAQPDPADVQRARPLGRGVSVGAAKA